MRKTSEIDDPKWQDLYDRDGVIKNLLETYKTVRDEMEASGGWVNDEASFNLLSKAIEDTVEEGPERYRI
jgi:hypothetical protein